MALVAYSDESEDDLSDHEEEIVTLKAVLENDKLDLNTANKKNELEINNTLSKPPNIINKEIKINKSPSTKTISTIEDIIDEDEQFNDNDFKVPESIEVNKTSQMFSTIPAPKSDTINNDIDINEEDEVTDVPTVATWKITQDIIQKKIGALPTSSKSESNKITTKRKKIQFVIPSLSEFSDDEEADETPKKKIIRPTGNAISGLFALLPEPVSATIKQTNRPLIPYSLTKKTKPSPTPVKPKPKVIKTISEEVESEEDDKDSDEDYFSLSKPDDPLPVDTTPIPVYIPKPKRAVSPVNTQISMEQSVEESVINNTQNSKLVTHIPQEVIPETDTNKLSEEALLKLAGKRNKGEIIDIVDFNADSILLDKEEWMNKALTEEKPIHGFSNKKEGMPTHQQKRKHQITYLAHQAQEREVELKNTWATNRMTKKETQSRYGF